MVILAKFSRSCFLLGIALAAFLSFSCFRLDADTPATGTIDLRQPANLKMIFDGGLRPYRLQGLESSSCVIDRTNITVILPDASPFMFEADRGSFSILAGNDIYGIDLFGLYTDVPDAVQLAKNICSAAQISSNGLDEVAANLGNKPSDKYWTQYRDSGQIHFQITFRPMYYFDHVGAYVNIGFHCGDHYHGMKFLTKPIQPPPGYENVSMDPPPIKPSGRAIPGMTLEDLRAKIQANLAEETNQPPPPPEPPTPATKPQASPATNTGIPWWIYGLIVLSIVVVVVAGYYNWSRKRNGP